MKRILLSFLALVALGAPAAIAAKDDASDTKPVIVAAFSGYGELKRDIEYLGKLSGNPDMAKGLEGLLMIYTQNQGLAGLDQARPWGAAVSITADGSQFPALGFLPVTDLKALLDATATILGEADDAGDEVYEIKKGVNAFFIKQKGKWAYIAQQKGALEGAPADPLQQLRGLDKEYDLAVSFFVQSIPQALRDMAADLIKQGMEAKLQQSAGDDDEQAELQAQIARQQAEAFVKRINEIDQLTVGLNIDRKTSRTFVDIALTAVEGSDTAKQFASETTEPESSRFAGVLRPDAMLSLHINSPVSDEDEEQFEEVLKTVSKQLMQEIDDEDDLSDDQKEKSKELVSKLLEEIDETLEKEGRINAGLAVVGAQRLTLALGALVADAEELEDVVKEFVSLAAEDLDLPKPKWNVGKYKGHRFHALSVPLPNDEDDDNDNVKKLKQAFGDPLKVSLAFGEKTFYLGLGEAGVDTVKELIDSSAETPEKLSPMTVSLALAQLLKFASAQSGNPLAAMMAQGLEAGKDRIKITLQPLDNGVRYRIEAEEGINKLLGAWMGNSVRGI
ncbi:MAG TPA: hypothetical protein VG826_09650 [Pirellulales bacterium]|nr:hypothetical protein [Pirellulales bacterium]